jgi:hypothetical protein
MHSGLKIPAGMRSEIKFLSNFFVFAIEKFEEFNENVIFWNFHKVFFILTMKIYLQQDRGYNN